MRKIYFLTSMLMFTLFQINAQMGINKDGTAPHQSAMLDIKASANTNAKGLLMPRVADHTVITSPATGLIVFNTTTNTFWYYNGTAWTNMGNGGTNGAWLQNGTNVYTNNNNVGINTATPQTSLDIKGGGFLVSQKTKLTANDPSSNERNMPLSDTQVTMVTAGTLHDPSGPLAPYPSGSINTNFFIMSEICTRNYPCRIIGIKLTFEVFDTEANGDSVIISGEGNTTVKLSGNVIPPDLYFSGNTLNIRFKTNGNSIVGQGFKIKWQGIEEDGTSTPLSGIIGNATFFDVSKGLFRSGSSSANLSESMGNYSVGMGYRVKANGYSSAAIGYSTSAGSIGSVAMGYYSNASGDFSTAMNYYTNATTTASFAAGYQTKSGGYASTALGQSTMSSSTGSLASGFFSNASGYASTALGHTSTASNTASLASGYGASASGYVAVALGNYTNASGYGAVAMGSATNASGGAATTMGSSTSASGYASLATGYNTNATSNAYYGTATGYYTTASSTASFASGSQTISGGYASTSMGYNANASGYVSTALGNNTNASGYIATAMGTGTVASGFASTAMGYNTIASGNHTTALGSHVNAYLEGSFGIGDTPNSGNILYSQNYNSFNARFRGGYYLYTNANASIGVSIGSGGSSWSITSDSTKKENFLPIDGENVLKKIANMRTVTWNYKGQDPKLFRHYGPMAQEFFSAFGRDKLGVVGNDTTIASADFDGVNFTAIKALEKRTSDLQAENELLKKRLALLEKSNEEISILKSEMEELKALLLPEREKMSAKKVSEK